MKNNFENYIYSLPLPKEVQLLLTDPQFKKHNPSYYQHYPELFKDYFNVSDSQIELLNYAGYLYYRSVLLLDYLIDEQQFTSIKALLITQEESIKILAQIYPLDHRFWKFWNERKKEYFEATILDKNLINKAQVTIQDYENLADQKSCFGKVAIDCLYALDNINEECYHQLLLSHRYFSTAFQINDDIQNFKEDFKKKQFNYAVFIAQEQQLSFDQDIQIVEKLMYIRGHTNKLYQIAIEYCNKAIECVPTLNEKTLWEKVIQSTKLTFERAILETNNYLHILKTEVRLSVEYVQTISFSTAINKAVNFLKENQQADGSWKEYINQGGISSFWSTAFINYKLASSNKLKSVLNENIQSASKYLNQIDKVEMVSYNQTWIGDCDSTTFAMLSSLFNKQEISQERIRKWLCYQQSDGGFSTYNNAKTLMNALRDENISSVTGWVNAHFCVSSTALYFLLLFYDVNCAPIQRLLKYHDQTALKTYWWTDDIYAWYYLSLSYELIGDWARIEEIKTRTISHIDENGLYNDSYGPNLFYSGMALEILLLTDTMLDLTNKIQQAILKAQYVDGSWENSSCLLVPHPDTNNSHFSAPFPIKTLGTNVRAKEFNRLFTTSTILKSLDSYERKFNS